MTTMQKTKNIISTINILKQFFLKEIGNIVKYRIIKKITNKNKFKINTGFGMKEILSNL